MWQSVDPMAERGPGWSAYCYTFDNPVRYVDPTGMWPDFSFIEGYVYDQDDKQPLSGVRVIINSDRFEDDNGNKNYDEYLGHDEIKLYTNQDGYYSTLVNKSAFIWIDFKKEGYANKTGKGSHSQKKMSYEAYLNKHH